MTLQQLLYLCEIADKKSYSRAAEGLFVTQSSLSHAMADLESELGVPLFFQNRNKEIELTKYGQTLIVYARDIVNHVNYAREAIEAMGQEKGNYVRILSSSVSGVSFVFDVFKDFDLETEHSEIKLSFETVTYGHLVSEKLKKGIADFIISGAVFPDDLIVSEPIGKQQMYVMVSAHSPLAQAEKLTINDFKDKPVLHYKRHRSLQAYIESLYDSYGLRPKLCLSDESWDVLATNVALGQGVMITPRLFSNREAVSYIPIDDPKSTREVYISYLAGKKMSQAARVVLDYCRTHKRLYE